MRQFNIIGNNEMSEFDMYWKEKIRVMETESAHGAHDRRDAAGCSNATNRTSRANFISTNHLIKITIDLHEMY